MNFRLLLSIAFITALAACGGAEERKAVYMEKAKSSIEAGDLDKARIELKNVLQIDPKDSEAFYQLGYIYEQRKDYRKAYANYLKAEELDPDLLKNQARLGRIYLLLINNLEKAQEKIDLILTKEPANAEGLLLKAALLAKEKDIAQAIKIAASVVANNPDHVDGSAFLATLYFSDKNKKEAIRVLERALKNNQDNEKLNRLMAVFLLDSKDYERAEVIYKGFLERNPNSIASYNNLAAFYNQIGNKEKTEAILRASIDNDSDDVERQIKLIRYIKTSKGDDEAIKEVKGLIARNENLGQLRIALAQLYMLKDDRKSATNVYLTAINDFSEEDTGIESRISLASIYIDDQDYSKANTIINEALSISSNDPKVNLLRAKLAIHEKDNEKAIISLRIVIKETPDNIEAHLLLANIYQVENNPEQLKITLNAAYESNKTNPDALLPLVKYTLASDINLAEKIVDDYNNLKENEYEGISIKAAILNQNKEFSEAVSLAKILMDLYPDRPNGYMQAIQYHIQKNDKQTAVSILEKGYINAKDNRKLLLLLTAMQNSEKQFDVVENRIKAELNTTPEDEELKLLLSKVYLSNKKIDDAENLLKGVVDNDSVSEEAYLLLARIYQSKKEYDAVEVLLLKGKKNIPASTKIPLGLATLYEFKGNYSAAIDIYRELNLSYPDNLVITNNLASLLSDYGDGKSDLELAKTLADKLLENKQPVFLDTIGWVNYKFGDYQNAITYLKQVVEMNPEVNVFNYHLGMAYKMSGDKAQARGYLEKSLANNKQFKEKDLAEAALKDL